MLALIEHNYSQIPLKELNGKMVLYHILQVLFSTAHSRQAPLPLSNIPNPCDFFLFFVFVFGLVLVFQDRVSLCSFGASPGIHSVDQAALKPTEINLPLPPKCWD